MNSFGASSLQYMRTTTPTPNSTRVQHTKACSATLPVSNRADRATLSQPTATQYNVSLPGYATSPSAPAKPAKDYEAAFGALASSYGTTGAPCLPKRDSSNSKARSSLVSRIFHTK
ncbi:hypothetical protein FIBSPDRAFT_1037134 [Athelia psychrophila]|uniref:Uncharacterized protein n=1 Tax=Athelia psychrophila TaxID=1759441 RepID=A0A166UTS5_9AGAM|nr:hypothetical protein FIBSPDRAFT_1037134 [Fibularhizoctonia sp. CBS 109695]